NWMAHGGKNVFLQDGNTIALSAERLLQVLEYLREKLPTIERITSYGRAETLSKVSSEQFKALKKAGLDRIHSGFESGSDEVLKLIEKGTTSEQQILAGKNIKEGGIELSVYFMPGVGGKALTIENALGTARVVNEINPDFVRIRTAAIKEGTGLWQKYLDGTYELCSDNEKVREIKILIENTKDCTGMIASDHIINLLQDVHGRLDVDKAQLVGSIDAYLGLPLLQQKRFQLARRVGLVVSLSHMKQIPPHQLNQIDEICKSVTDEKEWDFKMNDLISSYI
ncbi:MAG: radical SAM protein, partial [Anaerovorax sp.]